MFNRGQNQVKSLFNCSKFFTTELTFWNDLNCMNPVTKQLEYEMDLQSYFGRHQDEYSLIFIHNTHCLTAQNDSI